MIAGDPAVWQTGIPLLIAVVVIGTIVLWRNRRPMTAGFVVAAALLVLAVTVARARFGSPAVDMSSMQSASGVAPIPVTTAVLRRAGEESEVNAPATVAPYLTQDIVARVPGIVEGLSVYTGDRVHVGDVIAHLDEPELQSDAQEAAAQARSAQSGVVASTQTAAAMKADVDAKRAQYSYWSKEIIRERSLFEQGAVSAQEYQDERSQAASARAAFDAARSSAEAAQSQVSAAREQASAANSLSQSKNVIANYSSVIVPQDGIVVKRLVDPGTYVPAGTAIARVATIDRLRIQAQVAQQDLAGITVGVPVDAIVDGKQPVHGRVTSITPIVDPTAHTATVEAIVENAAGAIQPGGYARMVVHRPESPQRGVFSVPSPAIVGGAHPYVWVVENDSVHRHTVVVLSDNGARARIRVGLRDGTRVVVDGASNLEDGDPVTEASP